MLKIPQTQISTGQIAIFTLLMFYTKSNQIGSKYVTKCLGEIRYKKHFHQFCETSEVSSRL